MKNLFLVGWLLGTFGSGLAAGQDPEEIKNHRVDQILTLFYNNLDSIEKHSEAKTAVSALIEEYPDDPLLYELWCAIEWSAISLELEMKLDERRNILGIAPYRKRAESYHALVEQGLQLTNQLLVASTNNNLAMPQRSLFAKGALYYADAKFIAKFENGLAKADEAAARGIKEFKKLLATDQDFSAVYLYLGGARYQISSQGLIKRLAIRFGSQAFAEIDTICKGDVVNKDESIQWLERAYCYGAPQPWLRKNWMESAFVLYGAYEKLRLDKQLKSSEEEQHIREKELPVLLWLLEQIPENKKLQQKQILLDLRLNRKD